jgi:hydrogenase maturation protease
VTETSNSINVASQAQHHPPLIRVIAIGSHHGTDVIGWLASEKLQKTLQNEQLDWRICRNPTHVPELVQDCDIAVIIDALLSDQPAGQVINLSWPINQINDLSSYSTHGINVIQALQLAATLGQLPSQTYLIGLSVTNQEQDTAAIVSKALPQLQQALSQIINQVA